MNHDKRALEAIRQDPNMMVPWLLMAAYTYERLNESIISDGLFDSLCRNLCRYWDKVEHRHKCLIDHKSLTAGTGLAVNMRKLPAIIRSAAHRLLDNLAPVSSTTQERTPGPA